MSLSNKSESIWKHQNIVDLDETTVIFYESIKHTIICVTTLFTDIRTAPQTFINNSYIKYIKSSL